MRIRRLAVVTGAVAAIAGGVWAKVSKGSTSSSETTSSDGSAPEPSEPEPSSEKATS